MPADTDSDPRAYRRLAVIVRKGIADGTYRPGTPVPSITVLSRDHGHARATCGKALGVLVREGLLIRYPGLGYYVAAGSRGAAGPATSPAPATVPRPSRQATPRSPGAIPAASG